ncbi:MAG: alpha/beta hydrolase [Betaproteobacteria bacterium]|nr:alpha/beta hydrolase [Betaproteobacteria bacterium]
MQRRPNYRRHVDIRPSLRTHALNAFLRIATRKRLTPDTDVGALRQQFEALDARHFRLPREVTRTAVDLGGVAAEWISVPESRPERVLVYLHGGSFAFRFPNAHAGLAARICRQLRARALIPDYRLAPENPYPAAPDDCHAVYRALLGAGHRPRDLVLIGDSAGGNLALVTLHRVRVAEEPFPACAVLLSPALDCTMTSPSMAAFDGADPMLALANLLVLRRFYVPSPILYTDPEVSPLFASFDSFPPLLLQAGETEMLRDEAIRAAERADEAGVDVELELWPGVPHGFQVAGFLPEATLAIRHIVRFVRMRTGWGDD